jgi:hypothetical protein
MSTEHKVSFAKIPGAGTTTAVAPTPPAPVAVDNSAPAGTPLTTGVATPNVDGSAIGSASAQATSAQLTAPTASAPVPREFYDGDEEIPDTDGDVRTPWLSLIQSTTKDKSVGDIIQKDGTYVFKKAVALDGSKGFRAVILKVGRKFYVEKLEYIQNRGPNDPKPRIANSAEELAALGGTDLWEFSNQNVDKKTKIPKYATPFFEKHIKFILAVECPVGVDDSHFPHVFEGRAFAPTMYEAKGGSFATFFVPINSERKGRFKENWQSLYINITSRQNRTNPAYSAIATVGEATSPGLQEFLKTIRG